MHFYSHFKLPISNLMHSSLLARKPRLDYRAGIMALDKPTEILAGIHTARALRSRDSFSGLDSLNSYRASSNMLILQPLSTVSLPRF